MVFIITKWIFLLIGFSFLILYSKWLQILSWNQVIKIHLLFHQPIYDLLFTEKFKFVKKLIREPNFSGLFIAIFLYINERVHHESNYLQQTIFSCHEAIDLCQCGLLPIINFNAFISIGNYICLSGGCENYSL